jgi:sulfotransferase
MDSLERLVRRNALDVSKLFNNPGEAATVYSRTEALGQGSRLVGFAYNALKEAYYSDLADKLLLVDYELLTLRPQQTLALIYQFLGEAPFEHDFDHVDYDASEFDFQLRTEGLHKVRSKVEFVPRRTILPPDLFERFSQLTFWADPTASKANVIATKPKSEASESTF